MPSAASVAAAGTWRVSIRGGAAASRVLAIPASSPTSASLSRNSLKGNRCLSGLGMFLPSLCARSRAMISGSCYRPKEAIIDAVSIWQNAMAHFEQLERHLLDEILVFANLIQIPAVIL